MSKSNKIAIQTWIAPEDMALIDDLIHNDKKKYRSRSHFAEVAILNQLRVEGNGAQ